LPLYDIYSPVNPVAASSVQRWSVETNTVLKTCTTDAHQQKCQTDPFQACAEDPSCMLGVKIHFPATIRRQVITPKGMLGVLE